MASEMMAPEDAYLQEGIIKDIEDMDAIINQFIAYIRQDQQAHEPMQINQLIEDLVQLEAKRTDGIEMVLSPDCPVINMNIIAVKRVLANLVENARRYGNGWIRITSGWDKEWVRFCVEDNGPGIRPDQIQTLFQPFTQGDTARGSVGSGLGLAIIKRIVERHQGQILLDNRREGGLRATVRLPRD
jgi:two-component system osmolarity sensor histidine kinase EnvZ